MRNKTKIGRIPESITNYYSQNEVIKRSWDDLPESIQAENITVFPAFPSDTGNPKSLDSGKRWAENRSRNRMFNYQTGKWEDCDKMPVISDTQPNLPKGGYRLVNFEIRSEGGRAWKVISKEGYYFDLREDILLDIMVAVGISEGGYIPCDLIWARIGSQMKLIRVGSELYDAIRNFQEHAAKKKLSVKDLVPGTVYVYPRGTMKIFIANTRSLRFKHNGTWEKYEITNQLWYDFPKFRLPEINVENITDQMLETAMEEDRKSNFEYYRYSLYTSTPNVIAPVGKVNIGNAEDIVQRVSSYYLQKLRQSLVNIRERNAQLSSSYNRYGIDRQINMEYTVRHYLEDYSEGIFLRMREIKGDFTIPSEYKNIYYSCDPANNPGGETGLDITQFSAIGIDTQPL